ncbi:MAG: DUF362 domain-containing protein [Armatimonadia bacterium]
MDRRDFLKASALAAGAAASGLWSPAQADGAPRVSVARSAALETMEGQQYAAGIRALTFIAIADAVGASNVVEAMKQLFKPEDRVAIKVNCIAPQMGTQPEVVSAVVEALTFAGVDNKNIIIFDKEDRDLAGAGFTCTATGEGPMVYGTVGATKNPGYEERFTEINKTSFCLSKIVTRECTAIVNVPVIKQHCFAGMTCALKNHFGSIHNPEDFHYIDGCNPAVADVNLATAIRQKQRLCVVDAIWLQYDNGPAYSAKDVAFYGAIMAGTDPVALDTQVHILLDLYRKAHNLPPLDEVERPPKHIKTAAEYKLGCGDPNAIQLVVRDG